MAKARSPQMASEPVRLRLQSIQDVLQELKQAKTEQDLTKYPGAGRGVWISFQLWRAVTRQLELQMAEVLEWENLLVNSQKELGNAHSAVQELEEALKMVERAAQAKISGLEGEVSRLQGELETRAQLWAKHKADLGMQADDLLGQLRERERVLKENEDLGRRVGEAAEALAESQAKLRESEAKAGELQKRLDYVQSLTSDGITERDAMTFRVRDLGLQLAGARAQLETYRQQLAARVRPDESLVAECKRLIADNRRLVALLGATKEWKRLGRELAGQAAGAVPASEETAGGGDGMSAGGGGGQGPYQELGALHYVPVEEVVMHKGGVSSLYPALSDRPMQLEAAGIDPEEWHWVPKQAVDAVLDAASRVLPSAPTGPLLGMLLAVNKIWRQRESVKLAGLKRKHEAELREIHTLYRQRAPYETVVGRTRVSELKKQLRLQAEHAALLAARAQGKEADLAEESKMVLKLGLESVSSLSRQVSTLSKRAGRLRTKLAKAASKPTPVCPSCLDNILLQATPQVDPYQTTVVNPAHIFASIPPPSADERLRGLLQLPPGNGGGSGMSRESAGGSGVGGVGHGSHSGGGALNHGGAPVSGASAGGHTVLHVSPSAPLTLQGAPQPAAVQNGQHSSGPGGRVWASQPLRAAGAAAPPPLAAAGSARSPQHHQQQQQQQQGHSLTASEAHEDPQVMVSSGEAGAKDATGRSTGSGSWAVATGGTASTVAVGGDGASQARQGGPGLGPGLGAALPAKNQHPGFASPSRLHVNGHITLVDEQQPPVPAHSAGATAAAGNGTNATTTPAGATAGTTAGKTPAAVQRPLTYQERVNRLADLIAQYEAPVLQYSVWDRAGQVTISAGGSGGASTYPGSGGSGSVTRGEVQRASHPAPQIQAL